MKFAESWLRSLADPPVGTDALCERLTMAGLEVESCERLGTGLENVVVGEIVDWQRHPNADKLSLCRVDAGAGRQLQIVCGAPNARLGLKAPVALVGAKLPGGLEIKRAALRGVDSEGMLCSARELGLGDDQSGLWELPADAKAGEPLAKFLALPDATIELKLTPNRPDCLGLRGLAREVATLFRIEHASTTPEPAAVATSARRAVTLSAPADCPRYLGRVVEGIDASAKTPFWMVERLRRSGLRSISPVVDCTNYVMLELGQPMHAFDHDRLHGAIDVRRARAGERVKLLDGSEHELTPEFLVIADQQECVGLAGLMGGHDSRVTDATRNLFLEAAHFAPAAILGRARKLGMHTDASHRFERGVDPELPRVAMERITGLLLGIVGGKPGPITEALERAHLPKRPPVSLRHDRLQRVLGLELAAAGVEAILHGLGLGVGKDARGWLVTPPSARFDIEIEEDLIEEVARVHGYERIPTHASRGELEPPPVREGRVDASVLRRALCARGYFEAVDLSFVAPQDLSDWGVEDGAVPLANALSQEISVMRTSLLPGLALSLRRNLSRQRERVRLYETGAVFGSGVEERERVAGIACGGAVAEQWGLRARPLDFHDVKGDVEQLLALTGASEFDFAPCERPFLHPGRAAEVLRTGASIGVVGGIHPRLARRLELPHDTFVFELDLAALLQRDIPRAGPLSRFPSIRRDLALVLPREVPYARVAAVARAAAGARLRDLLLFDEYRGQGLPDTARSLAIGLILQDTSRTLTEQEAAQDVSTVVAALERELGARLRS